MFAVSDVPLLALSLTFIAAVAAFYLTRLNRRVGEYFSLSIVTLVLLLVFSMYPAILRGEILSSNYQLFSIPLSINFRVDALSFYMAAIISALWLLATVYSWGYLAHSHAHDRYYAFLLLVFAGNLGTVLAGDLIGLLLFFEIMAVGSYILIVHEEDETAMFAGAKYLYMAVGAGLGIFFSVIVVYFLAGDLSLGQSGMISGVSGLSLASFLGFLLGFGIKAGVFPLHVWLPDAHPAAPAPVSALLSGVMLKIGVYGLIRIFYDVYGLNYIRALGWNKITLVIATITILLGSALALRQDDLKRRLAYSSIAQIGYIVLGLSLLTEQALAGAVFHIFTHAVMKGCLFLCAGAIIVQTGKRKISQMKGIGYQMPLTMICFTLASLSMVGIPPFNGFITKWYIGMGALACGEPFYVILLIISSLLNAAYYFPIIIAAFFAVSSSEKETVKDAPVNMLIPVIVLGIFTFVFALLPEHLPLQLARAVSHGLFNGF